MWLCEMPSNVHAGVAGAMFNIENDLEGGQHP